MLATTLTAATSAVAKGAPPEGEEGGNNLSYPTIMLGGGEFTNVNCPQGVDARVGFD